jgi:hypothetical protein
MKVNHRLVSCVFWIMESIAVAMAAYAAWHGWH